MLAGRLNSENALLMMIPDDRSIKVEIDDISRRIDHIIKTVNRYVPAQKPSENPETTGAVGDEDGIQEITE